MLFKWICVVNLLLLVQTVESSDVPSCTCQPAVGYRGYRLLGVTVSTEEHNQLLRRYQNDVDLDFWRPPARGLQPVAVMVPPQRYRSFRDALEAAGMTVEVGIEDVQRYIDDVTLPPPQSFEPNEFNPFDLIQDELNDLVLDCLSPGGLVQFGMKCRVVEIGQSWEDRPLNVLEILTGQFPNTGKSMWIDSLTHAREWLTGAVSMKIAHRLINEYATDPEVRDVVDRFDHIYILPVVNPDGYAHSMVQINDMFPNRLWRKNRRPGGNCLKPGVDINRNFDFNWGGPGAAADPCDDTYRGPGAASEPETQAIQNYLATQPPIEVFLTVHAYGQFWLIPFGDGSLPANWADTLAVAQATTQAIEATFNTDWLVGNSEALLYETSGTTADWAQGALNAPYSYTPEVRPEWPMGWAGFLAEPAEIQPAFEELWEGLKALIASIP